MLLWFAMMPGFSLILHLGCITHKCHLPGLSFCGTKAESPDCNVHLITWRSCWDSVPGSVDILVESWATNICASKVSRPCWQYWSEDTLKAIPLGLNIDQHNASYILDHVAHFASCPRRKMFPQALTPLWKSVLVSLGTQNKTPQTLVSVTV